VEPYFVAASILRSTHIMWTRDKTLVGKSLCTTLALFFFVQRRRKVSGSLPQ